MRDIISLLLTILGCVIFINLLPTLIWLFLVIMGIAFVYTLYQRYKATQYHKDAQNQSQTTYTNTTSTNKTVNPDVIDVEYTESEEEIS